jgi:hypothetical protein
MPEITTRKGYQLLDTFPIGEGGIALNANFTKLGDFNESFESHVGLTTGIHGSTSLNTANRLVQRNASGGFSAGVIAATEINAGNGSQIGQWSFEATTLTADSGGGIDLNGGSLSAGSISATSITDNISNQRVQVSLSGSTVGTRRQINLIPGSGVSLNVQDNSLSERIDVTLTATSQTTSLDSLSDVVIASPSSGNVLSYDGNNWVNSSNIDVDGINVSSIDIENLVVSNNVELEDGVNIDLGTIDGTQIGTSASQKIGFFGATPVVRRPSNSDIRQVLIDLGFLFTGGATPLDLNGGNLTASQILGNSLEVSGSVTANSIQTGAIDADDITATSIDVNSVIASNITDDISVQRIELSKNGTVLGSRKEINLIEGPNIDLSVVSNGPQNRFDVTIDAKDQEQVTASNEGAAGVGVFKQKVDGNLEFKNINAASSKITVFDDTSNNEVDIDVDPSQISHTEITDVGSLTHTEIDIILSDLAPSDAQSLEGQPLDIQSGLTLFSGKLSESSTASYKTGDGAGETVDYISRNSSFSLRTPSPSTLMNKGDSGFLRLYINSSLVDSFDLGSAFNEGEREGSQSYPGTAAGTSPNGMIIITSVEKYNNFRAYQKVNARIDISSADDLIEGYNSIQLVHDLPEDQSSSVFDIFYDNDAGADPSLGSASLSLGTASSSRYLSGVRYLTLSDTVLLSVTGNRLFSNTHHSSPIRITGLAGLSATSISPADSSVSGVSNPPEKNETMVVSNKVLSLNVANVSSSNSRVTCTPRDVYGSYSNSVSPSQGLLVSTFQDGNSGQSSNSTEYFTDEYYRLPLNSDFDSTNDTITGQWDSQSILTNGNAQCFFASDGSAHALAYPQEDFTTNFVPSQTADYSSFSGDQIYVRAFLPSSNKTSILVTLHGISGGIDQVGSGDFNVEVKLPTQTGWLDGGKPFSSSAGVDNDGDGCLSGSISYSNGNASFTLTFGGKTTGDSGDRAFIRLTLRNSNRTVESITTNW